MIAYLAGSRRSAGQIFKNIGRSATYLISLLVVTYLALLPCASVAFGQQAAPGTGVAQAPQTNDVAFADLFTQTLQRQIGMRVAVDAAGVLRVVKLKDNSPAVQAGLKVGDEVRDARMVGSQIVLIYFRNGKSNAVTIDNAVDLAPQLPVIDSAYSMRRVPGQPFTLGVQKIGSEVDADSNGPLRLARPLLAMTPQSDHPPINLSANQFAAFANYHSHRPLLGNVQDRMRLIAKYEIELMIDKSNSMGKRDCPNNMSRWEWCGMQAQDMANRLTPYLPQGLNITSFAATYNVYEHVSPATIAQIFNTEKLVYDTQLAAPMRDRIGKYLAARHPGSKPLLVAIITDGSPSQPEVVFKTIKYATDNMTYPGEIAIVIFRVGNNPLGLAFLQRLPGALVNEHVRYDIVRIVDFERLEQIGLAEALVETLQGYGL